MRKGKYITWSELKVGIMVVLTFSLLAMGIFFLGREGGLFMKRYTIKTYMVRINGLQIGAPVWLAGVRVGSVTDIQFPSDITRSEIEVTLEINEHVRERIRKDSLARIGTLGLLGDKFVSITQGTTAEEIIPPGGVIEATTPIDVEQLIATASGAIEDLVVAIEHAQSITRKIDEGKGSLGKLINEPSTINKLDDLMVDMRALITKINSGEGTMGLLLNNPDLYNRLFGMVEKADRLASDIEGGLGTLGKLVNDPTLYNNLASLTARLDSVMVELRAGEGTAGKMLTDTELYEQMNKVSISLRELLDDVKENPKRYINVKIF
jgi:phospholipid/cholesterol/gamma-HCH transport system substrate-binding protein